MPPDIIAGRYRVLRELGRGGMGVVYLCEEEGRGRTVALKVLLARAYSEQALRHFEQEFRTLTALSHPNLIEVYDFGRTVREAGGAAFPFFTMEFIEGETLDRYVAGRPDDLGAVYACLAQVGQALAYLHGREIVHRDVKPSNILVRSGEEGGPNVKLMDLGLAGRARDAIGAGKVRGTMAYLSPEAARGTSVDPRSDLYSLGCVAYELVTGRPPFRGASALEILRAHLQEEPLPPSTLRRDLPPALDDLILRLLSKDPGRRPPSADRFLDLLGRAAGGGLEIGTAQVRRHRVLGGGFVGREVELRRLADRLEEVRRGDGRVVLLVGDEGIGKTRLLREFQVRCQIDGTDVFVGRSSSSEGGVGPFADALAQALRARGPRTEESDGSQRGVLDALLGVATSADARGDEFQDVDGPGLAAAAVAAVEGLARDETLVLAVEDLHGADETTCEILRLLSRRLRRDGSGGPPPRVLLLGTYRAGEVSRSSPLFDLLAESREGGVLDEVFVAPLGVEETARMLRAMLGVESVPDAFVGRVIEESRGNPLHVHELVACLAEEGHVVPTDAGSLDPGVFGRVRLPGKLRELLERRVRRIASEHLPVLRAAAALGGPTLDADAVSAVTGLRFEAVARQFQALQTAGLLERDEDESGAPVYRWAFPAVAGLLADATDADESCRLHTLIAGYLEKRGVPRRHAAWAAFARHAEAAGQTGRAAGAWGRSGDLARTLHAQRDALEAYSRAIDLLFREGDAPAAALCSLLEKRAEMHVGLGDLQQAEDDARVMLARASAAGSDRLECQAHLRVGTVLALREGYAEGEEHLDLALALAERLGENVAAVTAELGLGRIASKLGRLDAAVAHVERAASAADRGGSRDLVVESLLALGALFREHGDYRRSVAAFERAGTLAGRTRPDVETAIQEGLAAAREMQGRHPEAIAAYATARERARERGDIRAVASLAASLGAVHTKVGDDEAARMAFEEALEIYRRLGSSEGMVECLQQLGRIQLHHGRYDAAIETVEEALRQARRSTRADLIASSLQLAGSVYLQLGDAERAAPPLEEAHRMLDGLGSPRGLAPLLVDLGDLRARRGAAGDARRLYQESAFVARRGGDRRMEATATSRLGAAHLAEHDYDRALVASRKALALVEGAGLPREEAEVKLLKACIELERPGGDVVRAEMDALEATARFRDVRDVHRLWLAEHIAGRAAARLGRREEAAERVDRAWRYLESARARLTETWRAPFADDPRRREVREDWERLRESLPREARPAEAPRAVGEFAKLRDESAALRRLLDVNRMLGSERDPERLLLGILQAALELTGAERAFLLLRDGDALVTRTAAGAGGEPLEGDALSLSRSVARRAQETGEAILSTDAEADDRFARFESVHALRIRSVLAVPLRLRDEIAGAIYLDSRLDRGVFGPFQLELASRLAEQAAVAIDTTRMLARIEEQRERLERINSELEKTAEEQRHALADVHEKLVSTQSSLEMRYRFENMVGGTSSMQRVYHVIERLATKKLPVLIVGESGTGKELVARALHAKSDRGGGPFFTVNCAALTETLLESELFGHRKGAFTGADRNKPGYFELAHGGTLFLDEIGEMGPAMQAKLLRVLQEGEVLPVGGSTPVRVDVRVVSATHRDLGALIREGKFREDLFYRIHAARIEVPPLRERADDIPLLVDQFLAAIAEEEKVPRREIEPAALRRLQQLPWPGNVRELQHLVLRVSALARGATITARDLERYGELGPPAGEAARPGSTEEATGTGRVESLEELERRQILRALEEARGNKTRAAEILGINRATLFRKLRRFDLGS